MPTAAVNGATLHYEVVGSGPTCVVVPGWPGLDHNYLRPGLDLLATRLRLVYYDHRGTGRSGGQPAESVTVEQLADDAEALAAHLGADPVLVLGHFHGASVAQELALRHPARVSGLILVGATPGELGAQESLVDALDSSPTPPEVEVLQRVPPGTDEELNATMRALARFFFRTPGSPFEEGLFSGTTFDAEAAAQAMMANGWWSSVDRLGQVDVPALVLVGRHDVFGSPFQSQRISRHLRKATTVVFEDSGHLPWLEEPEAFLAAVEGWLGDLHLSGEDHRPTTP